MGLDLHPARPSETDEEREDYGDWYHAPDWPSPQWSYGGFHRFRQRLANHEGFDLDRMAGFSGNTADRLDGYSLLADAEVPGRDWSEVTTDLVPLLDHSDCDGELDSAACWSVYPRLEQVMDEWAARPDPDGGWQYDIQNGRALVEAMKKCAFENLTLVFR